MADSESTSKSPAFQFYPKDYLSDAKTRAMTFKQRGMYWDLVSHCWLEGALPSDPKEIARILGITAPARFAQHDWPVIGRCFRLVGVHHEHPRLEIERRKQTEYREEKAAAGRLGAARRWTDKSMAQPSPQHGTPIVLPMAKNASSSSSAPPSSDCGQKKEQPVDARSKRPIFRGQRLTVFDWMLDDLSRLLGRHTETFDLHSWFYALDAEVEKAGEMIPQRDGGKWLHDRTLQEAMRRGLPLAASTTNNPKTAGNLAAAARFVARGRS